MMVPIQAIISDHDVVTLVHLQVPLPLVLFRFSLISAYEFVYCAHKENQVIGTNK